MREIRGLKSTIQQPQILLCLFCLLLVAFILLISGFRGLYGQDSYTYLSYSRQITMFIQNGPLPGNIQWPVMYPLLGSLLSFLVSGEHLALMLLSVLAFVVSLLVCYKILFRNFQSNQKQIAIYLAMFLCCSPFLLRCSITLMSENAAIAFSLLAFNSLWHPNQKFRLMYFALWAALACSTRYAMGALLISPFLYLIHTTIKSKNYLSLIMALIFPILILSIELYFKSYDLSIISENYWLQNWSFRNYIENSFFNQDGSQEFRLPNLLHVFSVAIHPGFIFCGLLFLILSKFRSLNREHIIMLLSVLFYLFFQAGLATQSQRFLLPALPFVVLLFYPAFVRVLEWKFIRHYRQMLFMLVFLIQAVLIYRAVQPFVKRERMEKSIAQYMQQLQPQHHLYTTGLEGVLEVYGVKNPRMSLYFEEYKKFEKPAYVLVNPPELEKQWKGTLPYRNWKFLVETQHLSKIQELEGSWVVYELR